MPEFDEDQVKRLIRESADRQMPDAWKHIERSVLEMKQHSENKKTRGFFGWPAVVVACAAVALVAVAFAVKPGFLVKPAATTAPAAVTSAPATAQPTVAPTTAPATAPVDTAIRQPIPFAENTSLSKENGPAIKIRVFETLKDFVSVDYLTDIAQFQFVKEIGAEASADGMGLYTSYEMKVVKALKGSLKPGDTITVRVFGGASDKVWIEDDFVERFTGDFGYVLFLSKNADGDFYQLASMLQGYVPIKDGRVSLNTKIENNGLYTQGETLEDLTAKIEAALK